MIRSPGNLRSTCSAADIPLQAGHRDIQSAIVRNGLIAQSQSFFPIGGAELAIAKLGGKIWKGNVVFASMAQVPRGICVE